MADRPSRNRAVGRQGDQGPCEEFLLRASIAGRGGVNHPAPHGAVRTDQGHDDPHQLSLSPPGAFRQAATTMAACGHARPVIRLADCRKRDHAPQPSHERRRSRQSRRGRPARDDTASRAARSRRTAKRKITPIRRGREQRLAWCRSRAELPVRSASPHPSAQSPGNHLHISQKWASGCPRSANSGRCRSTRPGCVLAR